MLTALDAGGDGGIAAASKRRDFGCGLLVAARGAWLNAELTHVLTPKDNTYDELPRGLREAEQKRAKEVFEKE